MPLSLNTNVASLDARRYLGISQAAVERSYERLSSGYRLNSAADDAAGVAVTEALAAQLRAHVAVERNATNATSMSQTAESSLGQIGDVLIRMREIAMQAANGDLGAVDRTNLDVEFLSLRDEIERLSEATRFNDKPLLSGLETTLDFQIGIGSTSFDLVSVVFGGITLAGLGISASSVAGTNPSSALRALDELDGALGKVVARRAAFGAAQNRLGMAQTFAASVRTNLATVTSRIRDVDVAEESSNLARAQVLVQAGASLLAQANNTSQTALALLGGR